ncbi:STAS-like domain-containing protein [Vibrio parahaemolyticus]|uniref:STAS-like domain-containing protein n=1 Tax=Vibrio parahaemolyticus TaxID=670 RepID=UPI001EEACFD4|nr:STAS-like domain-containing protein [Vibrio parahaemolyticus]MBE3725419.1 STAS-like domain-containing protein [Vibrio parahaemolyticus]MCG6443637.1 STAS-like domain-containing protein [Vibrio parahaemolyticus]MCG6455973.1 STAS-like domain-containing protein [Vibrio parahaemolyticus]HCE2195151.1 STAS-like domain-containing protein [Vibrio parahaemolyticus]HCG6674124.1 STAS-like domain-containing protein [Vibrio parahaemolyticus]
MHTIKVKDFSEFPGPRFISLGPNSGEAFREEVLIPAIRAHGNVIVDLDGTFGYGSSFLEEAFGGLARAGIQKEKILFLKKNLISTEDPTYITEVSEYIDDSLKGV